MKRKSIKSATLLCSILAFPILLLGCTKPNQETTTASTAETQITCSDTSFTIEGNGATSAGNILTIDDSGTYVLTGLLSDGRIIVDAGDNDTIQLVLNGIDITCSDQAPISVSNAKEVMIIHRSPRISRIFNSSTVRTRNSRRY